ncbi:hypothetical protein, partial [Plasmodium yoelii yoelii]
MKGIIYHIPYKGFITHSYIELCITQYVSLYVEAFYL